MAVKGPETNDRRFVHANYLIPDDARGLSSHGENVPPDLLKKNPFLDLQEASLSPATSSQIPSEDHSEISRKSNVVSVPAVDNRDFKIWYGKSLVRRQIVKITSGDVTTRVPLRLSRRTLAFYYGKVPGFTYSSLCEYKPAVYFSF